MPLDRLPTAPSLPPAVGLRHSGRQFSWPLLRQRGERPTPCRRRTGRRGGCALLRLRHPRRLDERLQPRLLRPPRLGLAAVPPPPLVPLLERPARRQAHARRHAQEEDDGEQVDDPLRARCRSTRRARRHPQRRQRQRPSEPGASRPEAGLVVFDAAQANISQTHEEFSEVVHTHHRRRGHALLCCTRGSSSRSPRRGPNVVEPAASSASRARPALGRHYNGQGVVRPSETLPLSGDGFGDAFGALWDEHVNFGTSVSHKKLKAKGARMEWRERLAAADAERAGGSPAPRARRAGGARPTRWRAATNDSGAASSRRCRRRALAGCRRAAAAAKGRGEQEKFRRLLRHAQPPRCSREKRPGWIFR